MTSQEVKIQRAMSGKKEHRKGGKQYQQGEEKKNYRKKTPLEV